MPVTVEFNKQEVKKRISKVVEKAQPKLAKLALSDINKYTKEDTGKLIADAQIDSDFNNGLLIWDQVYARYQYYLPNTLTVINPTAKFMWAHYADKKHGKEWRKFLQKQLDKGV